MTKFILKLSRKTREAVLELFTVLVPSYWTLVANRRRAITLVKTRGACLTRLIFRLARLLKVSKISWTARAANAGVRSLFAVHARQIRGNKVVATVARVARAVGRGSIRAFACRHVLGTNVADSSVRAGCLTEALLEEKKVAGFVPDDEIEITIIIVVEKSWFCIFTLST